MVGAQTVSGSAVNAEPPFLQLLLVVPNRRRPVHLARFELPVTRDHKAVVALKTGSFGDKLGILPVDEATHRVDVFGRLERNINLLGPSKSLPWEWRAGGWHHPRAGEPTTRWRGRLAKTT